HADGARTIEQLYGVPSRLLRDGEGWSRETVTLGTHNSTHVDAPYHYNSTIQRRPAQTIDQLPLERFYGPGVVVDFTEKAAGDAPGIIWEAHQADLPYSQIERLFNLAALPPTGFTVACFPLRIVGASAAPARVVAILD